MNYWLVQKILAKRIGLIRFGSRSFYTIDKPIDKPNDLEGLKIRYGKPNSHRYGQIFRRFSNPDFWVNLYLLQQVDGAENNPPSFYLSRHYEVCKYYIIDEHTVLPDVADEYPHLENFVFKSKMIQEAMDFSVIEQRRLWLESEQNPRGS